MDKVTTWQGSCEDCFHWQFHDDGTGDCGLYSCDCATAITEGRGPTRFLSRYDVPVKDGGLQGEEVDLDD